MIEEKLIFNMASIFKTSLVSGFLLEVANLDLREVSCYIMVDVWIQNTQSSQYRSPNKTKNPLTSLNQASLGYHPDN